MASFDLSKATSILALLRRDVSAGCLADRFGVTEAQVLEWQDVFIVAGIMALAEVQKGGKVYAHLGQESSAEEDDGDGDPTTPTGNPVLKPKWRQKGYGKGGDPTTPTSQPLRKSKRKQQQQKARRKGGDPTTPTGPPRRRSKQSQKGYGHPIYSTTTEWPKVKTAKRKPRRKA